VAGPLPTDVVDLAVVGGGPAGTAAAITAARAGRRVVLVDKARFPRDKCCGDGLTTGALRHLESLGLAPGVVRSWQPIDDVVLRSPSGRTVTVSLPRGQGRYAAVARRIDLDAALLERARAVGVEVHEGAACTGVTPGPDEVGLTVGSSSRSAIVICRQARRLLHRMENAWSVSCPPNTAGASGFVRGVVVGVTTNSLSLLMHRYLPCPSQ